MRVSLLLLAVSLCNCPLMSQANLSTAGSTLQPLQVPSGKAASKPFAFPLQLEMRVPFDPTAFPNGLNSHLLYELYLTNFAQTPTTLDRIDVLDAAGTGTPPIGSFDATQL